MPVGSLQLQFGCFLDPCETRCIGLYRYDPLRNPLIPPTSSWKIQSSFLSDGQRLLARVTDAHIVVRRGLCRPSDEVGVQGQDASFSLTLAHTMLCISQHSR